MSLLQIFPVSTYSTSSVEDPYWPVEMGYLVALVNAFPQNQTMQIKTLQPIDSWCALFVEKKFIIRDLDWERERATDPLLRSFVLPLGLVCCSLQGAREWHRQRRGRHWDNLFEVNVFSFVRSLLKSGRERENHKRGWTNLIIRSRQLNSKSEKYPDREWRVDTCSTGRVRLFQHDVRSWGLRWILGSYGIWWHLPSVANKTSDPLSFIFSLIASKVINDLKE